VHSCWFLEMEPGWALYFSDLLLFAPGRAQLLVLGDGAGAGGGTTRVLQFLTHIDAYTREFFYLYLHC